MSQETMINMSTLLVRQLIIFGSLYLSIVKSIFFPFSLDSFAGGKENYITFLMFVCLLFSFLHIYIYIGGNTPQGTNNTATCLPSRKLYKLD